MQAIQSSEQKITNQIDTLQLAVSNQSDYIESLEGELRILSRRVDNLAKQNARPLLVETKKAKPKKVVQPPIRETLPVLGSVETVTIDTIAQTYEARIDTGASTSSLNAINISEFERNGNTWVKFNLNQQDSAESEPAWIEAPLVRYAKIKHPGSSELTRRAVIELWIILGDIRQKAQFTLADRSHMTHPVLLGREFLKDTALVDVSKQYIHSTQPQ